MPKFQSTKQFGHELGISCAFRQWRATSHCNKIHGYALAFKFTFEADELDDRNWVQDFGGLKEIKQALMDTFDHKLVVANDDPELPKLKELHYSEVADVVILPAVGCEKFAEYAYSMASSLLKLVHETRIKLISVEVKEHGANSAIYFGSN